MTILRSSFFVILAAVTAACGGGNAPEPAVPAAADTTPAAANQSPSIGGVAATSSGSVNADGQAVNATGAATLEFQKRVQEYMKIHNDAEAKIPNLKRTDDPEEIAKREQNLQQTIMTLRAGATQGTVFAPEYQPYFVEIIKQDFAKRSAADRKALVHELPRNLKVDVNTPYPTTLPLITFPAGLLRKLPDLPPELEYRIVGRHLILRDAKANLIVDVLRDVVPTIPS